jgi:hypothetical protein
MERRRCLLSGALLLPDFSMPSECRNSLLICCPKIYETYIAERWGGKSRSDQEKRKVTN